MDPMLVAQSSMELTSTGPISDASAVSFSLFSPPAVSASLSSTFNSPSPLVLSSASLDPSPSISRVAPYAQGIRSTHVQEAESDDYSIMVSMKDNSDEVIAGFQFKSDASASDPLKVRSSLKDELICAPESQDGELQFTLGSQT